MATGTCGVCRSCGRRVRGCPARGTGGCGGSVARTGCAPGGCLPGVRGAGGGQQSCTGVLGVAPRVGEEQGAAGRKVPEAPARRSPVEAGAAQPLGCRPGQPRCPRPRRALRNPRCKGVCRALPPQQAKSSSRCPGREMPPVPSGTGLEQEPPGWLFPQPRREKLVG